MTWSVSSAGDKPCRISKESMLRVVVMNRLGMLGKCNKANIAVKTTSAFAGRHSLEVAQRKVTCFDLLSRPKH